MFSSKRRADTSIRLHGVTEESIDSSSFVETRTTANHRSEKPPTHRRGRRRGHRAVVELVPLAVLARRLASGHGLDVRVIVAAHRRTRVHEHGKQLVDVRALSSGTLRVSGE